MTKQEFSFRLKNASFTALDFAERYVSNKLKPNFRYNMIFTFPNHDNNVKFDIYPEDEGIIKLNLTNIEVIDLLYRKNKVPIWIDINVLKSSRKTTTFDLLCAGRYSDEDDELYYNEDHAGPFGIKSPTFPIGYKEGEKFKLEKTNIFKELYSKIKQLCFKNSF